jgi:hypothetical protein
MFCSICGALYVDYGTYCPKCCKPLYTDDAAERAFFVPREVSIRPNFHTILDDFELVEDTEQSWGQLVRNIDRIPKTLWNIWGGPSPKARIDGPYGGGFSFTFISPSVIHNPQSNNFASEVDFTASLQPVGIRRELLGSDAGEVLFDEYHPWLNLRSAGDGYRLSIEIPESRWSTIRNKDVLKQIADKDLPRHVLQGDLESWSPSVEIPLAVVPYEEFEVHFAEGACPLRYQLPRSWSYIQNRFNEALEKRTKARVRYGWKGAARPPEPFNCAEHRYCLVAYWSL